MSNKIMIELEENSTVAKITIPYNNKSKSKFIDIDTLITLLESSKCDFSSSTLNTINKQESIYYNSSLLPSVNGVSVVQIIERQNEEKIVFVKKDACRHDFVCYKNYFKNVGIPTLLFIFFINKANVIYDTSLYALDSNIVTNKSKIYAYPFTNVQAMTGKVCYGANKEHLMIKNLYDLFRIPDKFLMMPSTHELDYRNKDKLSIKEFLGMLENNDFDNDMLYDLDMKYSDLVNKIIG